MNVSQQIEVVIPCVSSGIPEPEITWYKTEETGETEKQLDSIGMCYKTVWWTFGVLSVNLETKLQFTIKTFVWYNKI